MKTPSVFQSTSVLTLESELDAAFSLFAPAAQGGVAVAELLRVLEERGAEGRESSLGRVLRHYARTGRLHLSRQEFKALMRLRLDELGRREQLPLIYNCYADGADTISLQQLRAVAREVGENVAPDLLREMLRVANPSGSGRVSAADFAVTMKKEFRKTLLDES